MYFIIAIVKFPTRANITALSELLWFFIQGTRLICIFESTDSAKIIKDYLSGRFALRLCFLSSRKNINLIKDISDGRFLSIGQIKA
jgi:hypothetical protein